MDTSDPELEVGSDGVAYRWRGSLTDAEMVGLVRAHGGRAAQGWWDQIRAYSLGWVTARAAGGAVIGFVNVAWDGGDHAFLLDTKTHGEFQHRGIGMRLVEVAALHAKAPRVASGSTSTSTPTWHRSTSVRAAFNRRTPG